jgi:hypothetical protein
MRLFGSKAAGCAAPDSDIDILVVVAEARTDVEDRILAIAFDVKLAHDVFISPGVVGRATRATPHGRSCPVATNRFYYDAFSAPPLTRRGSVDSHGKDWPQLERRRGRGKAGKDHDLHCSGGVMESRDPDEEGTETRREMQIFCVAPPGRAGPGGPAGPPSRGGGGAVAWRAGSGARMGRVSGR